MSDSQQEIIALHRARAQISGLKMLEKIVSGELRRAPYADLIGFKPTKVRSGATSFELEVGPDLDNGLGLVHGGALATLLDISIATAAQTLSTPGNAYVTTELNVRYLRSVPITTLKLFSHGKVENVSGNTVTCSATIYDIEDKKVAEGKGICKTLKYRVPET